MLIATRPEPIRSALIEGIGWWGKAFDAAGYIDAFQVKLLPEGADPMDVRYNVVNWVRIGATRGWSYGQQIVDPRTGEVVKGMVVLGSLRARQDVQIFEGLVGADRLNRGGPNDPVQVALARLRQLGAHEVGHSLGLAHNFAASTPGPRLSQRGLSGAAHWFGGWSALTCPMPTGLASAGGIKRQSTGFMASRHPAPIPKPPPMPRQRGS